ncbi:MAG: CCA tRNA nucleotidyltransferase [Candidatus Aenigmatarchaeota archaeon]
MASYSKVLKSVLKKIRPSEEEKKKLNSVLKKCLKVAKKEARKFKAKPMVAGSVTRDTWLPGKKEFDIFILFPSKITVKQLEKRGLEIGKKIIRELGGSFIIEYAQHPYVSGNVEGIEIDIVPCFDVKTTENLKSAVDRTPFHVKYLQKNLPLKLSDQVRLLKQFLTANKIYGADAKTEGFSGYVCELLIIKYKSFLNVLKQAVNWKPGEIIDIEKFYKKEDFLKLKKIFQKQVLILIDPTDKNRNTAAALSPENFFKFKKLAKEFLENPREEMFFASEIKPISEKELIEKLLERKTELLLIKFSPPSVVPDVLWPQLRRFAERLESILEETKYEFKVLRKDCYTNERDLAIVLLEMEVFSLPTVQKKVGPEVFDLDDSKRFLEKYKPFAITGPFIENKNWVVEIKRKFLTAREKLFDSLNKDANILQAKGIPNHIAEQISKGFEIISDTERIIELVNKHKDFGIFLRKYFEKENLVL